MTDSEIKDFLKALTPEMEKLRDKIETVYDKAEDWQLRENVNEACDRAESLLEYLKFFFH